MSELNMGLIEATEKRKNLGRRVIEDARRSGGNHGSFGMRIVGGRYGFFSKVREVVKTLIGAMVVCAVLFDPTQAVSEVIDRAEIYVVDGDTLNWRGERFRLVGFDTPETYNSRCDLEKRLGEFATQRVRNLIASIAVVELVRLPGRDRYQRSLGRLLINNRDVGDILITDGLARPYEGGRRQSWCW